MSIFGSDYGSGDLLVISNDLDMNGNRIKELKNPNDAYDAVNKRYVNKRIDYKIKYLEDKIDTVDKQSSLGTMTSDLDMANYRIINVAHPRDPNENSVYERDVVTSKFLYDYLKIADRKYLKVNGDNIVDGKLDMKQHKIIGLADPVDADHAVTKRYVSSRFHALNDAVSTLRHRMDRLESLQQRN